MKKLIAVIMCIAMILTAIPMTVFAADDRVVVKTGFCGEDGENLTWTLYADGELVISGEGKMDWYDVESAGKRLPPWFDYYDDIDVITVEEGVTSIGRHAFSTGFRGEGFDPASYYKINLPVSLEFFEDDMFYDNGKNRIPGQHLAYSYAGSIEEWGHIELKICSLTFSEETDGPIERTYSLVASAFNMRPEGDFESFWFNGEEPEAFCELVKTYTGDIDFVTHYYASNPEAKKIEWYMVNKDVEYKVGEIATNEHEAVEIVTPEFEEGDVYMKAKILDANGNVIVSSENLWIGQAFKEPTFFDQVRWFFQSLYWTFKIYFEVFRFVIDEGLMPEIIKSVFGSWF